MAVEQRFCAAGSCALGDVQIAEQGLQHVVVDKPHPVDYLRKVCRHVERAPGERFCKVLGIYVCQPPAKQLSSGKQISIEV
jgi:hypothetical protein